MAAILGAAVVVVSNQLEHIQALLLCGSSVGVIITGPSRNRCNSSNLHKKCRPARRPTVPLQQGNDQEYDIIENHDVDDDDDDDDDEIDVDSVSDAQALLACQAHLVRRKKVAWTAGDQRRWRRQQAQPLLLAQHEDAMSSSCGFFWEDPTQLRYLSSSRRPLLGALNSITTSKNENENENTKQMLRDDGNEGVASSSDRGGGGALISTTRYDSTVAGTGSSSWEYDSGMEEIEDEGIWETIVHTPDTAGQVIRLPDDDDDRNDTTEAPDDDSEFSAVDDMPSTAHVRRSLAVTHRWSDPTWKAKWYEQRWAGKKAARTVGPSAAAIRLTRRKVKRLDPDTFLASPEMAALTHDDISQAIRTAIASSRKRQVSHQLRLLERQKKNRLVVFSGETTTALPRDALLQPDPIQLQLARRKRSETAKRAYQTRLENKKKQASLPPKQLAPRSSLPTGVMELLAPKRRPRSTSRSSNVSNISRNPAMEVAAAMTRIEADVSAGRFPTAADVECILQPTKLARRRLILRLILNECFDLRGKCIPGGGEQQLLFVTHCPIHLIGAYILARLQPQAIGEYTSPLSRDNLHRKTDYK
jgi:hypothetical protein